MTSTVGTSIETERIQRIFDKMAGKYDRTIRLPERLLFEGGREWACSSVTGDVLEIAVGTGRNLSFYPKGIRLAGIELSSAMLEIARERAHSLGLTADLRQGDAQALPFADESFDTAICTLGLCCIPDPRKALSEARRVLRPHGKLVLMEHVRSPQPIVRGIQRALEPLMYWMEGDHLVRDPVDHLDSLGFRIEYLNRTRLGITERLIAMKTDRPPERQGPS